MVGVHLVFWLLNRDKEKDEERRARVAHILAAAVNAPDDLHDDPLVPAVIAKSRNWVKENGVAKPQSAWFTNEVVRWTGGNYVVYGEVQSKNFHDETVRNWFVVAIREEDLELEIADMLEFDPSGTRRIGGTDALKTTPPRS